MRHRCRRSVRRHQQPLAAWLLCLALAGRACEAAAARTTCQLVLEGHSSGRVGVSRASLACSPPADGVTLGVDTSLLGAAAAFSGVRVTAVADLRCQARAEQGRSGHAWRVLLFFCGTADSDVVLLQPLVRGVVLDAPAAGADDALLPSTSSSALLAFGSDVRARIVGGDISNNTAGAALLLLNSARLGLDGTRVHGNTCGGGGGGAITVMQQAELRVSNSSLVGNTATWSGGALHVRDGAHATIAASTIAGNTVQRGHAGAIAADGSAVVRISLSSIANNTAPRDGGGLMAAGAATVSIVSCVITSNAAGTDGGGIAAEEFVVLNVTDSVITGNKASTAGGGVSAHGMATVLLMNSSIANNSVSAALGCGGGVAVSQSARVSIDATTVTANLADSGGGIAAGGSGMVRLFGGTRLLDNAASLWGGGLALEDEARLEVPQAGIARISISGNTARDGGGVYLGSTHFVPETVRQITSGNSAGNEDNIAVEPTSLVLLTNTTVRNFSSRVSADKGVLPVRLRVSGWHGFVCEGRLVQAELLTAGSSGRTARQQLGANASDPNGIVSMDLKFRRPPGVYSIVFHVPSSPTVQPAEMQVEVRPCVAGEVTTSSPEARNDACTLCVAGRFSLNPLNATCDECPNHASCNGGNDITPLPGFWHSDQNSIQIHRCANPDACEGNRTLLLECKQADAAGAASLPAACSQPDAAVALQCSTGYQGHLCGRCAPGYSAAWSPFSCQRCMSKSAVIGIYVAASLVLLGAVKLVCWVTLMEGVRDSRIYAGGAAVVSGRPLPAASARLRFSDMLKPLILWMQWLLLLFSMNMPAWPVSLLVPLRTLAWLWSASAPGQTLALDCLLSGSTPPVPIQRLLLCICMPVLVAATLQFIEVCSSQLRCCHSLRRRRWRGDGDGDGDGGGDVDALAAHHQGRHYFIAMAIVTGYVCIPMVARAALSFFVCITLDEPASPPYVARAVGRWWVHDMQQQCYTGWHARWAFGLGVPLVVLLFFVLPCGLLWVLVRHRHRLHDPSCVHYAFLMRSYRPACYYWEAIYVVQTLSLVAISSWGYTLGTFYQALIMSFALAVICVVLLVVRPHAHPLAARAARGCVLCLLVTSYVTLSFLGPSYKDASSSNAYGMVMGVFLVVINVGYVLGVLGVMLRMVDLKQVRERLAGASACCRPRRQGPAGGAAAPGSVSGPSESKSDIA